MDQRPTGSQIASKQNTIRLSAQSEGYGTVPKPGKLIFRKGGFIKKPKVAKRLLLAREATYPYMAPEVFRICQTYDGRGDWWQSWHLEEILAH
jgi:hypothetical protein